jgi:hypothetical protein
VHRLGIEASAVARHLEVASVDDALVLDAGSGRLLEVTFVDGPLVLESWAGCRRPGAKQGRGVTDGKMQGRGMLHIC